MSTPKLLKNSDFARVKWGRSHVNLALAVLLIPILLGFLSSLTYKATAKNDKNRSIVSPGSAELQKITWGMPRLVSFVVVEGTGTERTEAYWSAFGAWTTIGYSDEEWRPVDSGNIPQYTSVVFTVLGIISILLYKLTDIVWLAGHGTVAFVTGFVSVIVGTLFGL